MAHSRHPDVPTPLSPYKPGMGLEPPYLGDRQAQLERFREFLVDQTPHNVVVTGLRGVGKTVLLQRYRSEALEAGWLVADREFSEADAEPSMLAYDNDSCILGPLRVGRSLVGGFGCDQ
jgi:hypothetical protein